MIWLAPPWGLYFNPWKVSLVEAEIGRNYLMMSVWSCWKETCAGSAVPAELGEVPMSEGRHFSLGEGRTELFLLLWVPAAALGWLSEADTEHLWKSHHQEGEQALPSSPWADLQLCEFKNEFQALGLWFLLPKCFPVCSHSPAQDSAQDSQNPSVLQTPEAAQVPLPAIPLFSGCFITPSCRGAFGLIGGTLELA